ncbi:DUF4405 domain-containing protein [Curvibacter gracilis]|uniref:DUF4405 domain-containing protein n=1 Tax=Curvibacter gracilis TaxID=230310 RepID=UPI000489A994|nr:DUF4405 domain-containing protein [Curvibacter gracilis]
MMRRLTTSVLLVAFVGMASSGLMMLVVDQPSFTMRLHPVHKVFGILLVAAVGVHLFTQAATLRRHLKAPVARSVAGLVLTLLVICYALAWMNPVAPESAQQLDDMARRIESGEAWVAPQAVSPAAQPPGLSPQPSLCDAPSGGR